MANLKEENSCSRSTVLKLKEGSEQAFEKIFKGYFEDLFLYARHYVVDEDVARNIVQDAYVILWEKREKIRDDIKLKYFLLTVVRNKCLNYLKREKFQQKYKKGILDNYKVLLFNYDALQRLNLSDFEFEEVETIINHTISSLPKKCQTVFRLSRFEGLSNKEIAENLGISVKTVEIHISRALRVLRASLKDYLSEWAITFLFFEDYFNK